MSTSVCHKLTGYTVHLLSIKIKIHCFKANEKLYRNSTWLSVFNDESLLNVVEYFFLQDSANSS